MSPSRVRSIVSLRKFVVALTLGLLFARPTSLYASPDWDNFDDPTDMTYNEVAWVGCLDLTFLVSGYFFREDCMGPVTWGDKTQESVKRQEVKYYERWVRSGLLAVGALMAGVEFIRDIVQGGKSLFEALKSITAGFDLRRPDQTAIRLASASDALAERLTTAQNLSMSFDVPNTGERFNQIHALVLRALSTARDAQENAMVLSDQATGMQMRLAGDGTVRFVAVGGTSDTSAVNGASQALPPLPVDAPAGALADYDVGLGLPYAVGSFAPEIAGPARVAALGGSTGDVAACPVTDDDTQDASVMFQRAIVMAKGAQMAATAPIVDVREARDEIQAINARERENDRLSIWKRLLYSFNMM